MMKTVLLAILLLCPLSASAQIIGDNTSNGSAGPTDLKPYATYFTATATDMIATISVYIGAYSGGTVHIDMALYADGGLGTPLPSNLMAKCTSSVLVTATGWVSCNLTCVTTCAIVNGTVYWLAHWLDSANATTTYDASVADRTLNTGESLTFPGWPFDFAESAGFSQQFAIYASVTGGGGGGSSGVIGDDSANGTAGATDLKPNVTFFSPSSSATLTSMSVYVGVYSGGTVHVDMALYADGGLGTALPTTLMAKCTSSALVTATGWVSCSLTCVTTCAVSNGTIYWLGHWFDSANASSTYDTGATGQAMDTGASLSFPGWPSDFAESTDFNRQYAIYASGGGGGGGGSSSRRRLLFGLP